MIFKSNGSRYEGHWKENRMHGKGIYFWADGRHYGKSLEFVFFHGIIVCDMIEGHWDKGQRSGRFNIYYIYSCFMINLPPRPRDYVLFKWREARRNVSQQQETWTWLVEI